MNVSPEPQEQPEESTGRETEQMIEQHQQALALSRENGDRREEAEQLGNLGNAYYALEQEEAIGCYEQALGIARELENPRLEAIMLDDLAQAYEQMGLSEEAVGCYRRAVRLLEEAGSVRVHAVRARLEEAAAE